MRAKRRPERRGGDEWSSMYRCGPVERGGWRELLGKGFLKMWHCRACLYQDVALFMCGVFFHVCACISLCTGYVFDSQGMPNGGH